MRVTNRGYLGIGNTTPSYKLDVTGIAASNTGFLISSGQYNNITEVPYTGIYMTGSSSPDGFGSLLISSRTDAARPIIFGTSSGSASAERMRIAASTGNLLIGTTTDIGYKLNVNGNSYVSGTAIFNNFVGINTNSPSYLLSVNQVTTNYIGYFGSSITNFDSNGLIALQSGLIPQSGGDTRGIAGINFLHAYGTGGVNSDANGGYIRSIRESVFATASAVNTSLVFATASANVNQVALTIKSTRVINIASIPTSSAGLSSGDIWSNAGVLNIVP
jgi:hypothetical protein